MRVEGGRNLRSRHSSSSKVWSCDNSPAPTTVPMAGQTTFDQPDGARAGFCGGSSENRTPKNRIPAAWNLSAESGWALLTRAECS